MKKRWVALTLILVCLLFQAGVILAEQGSNNSRSPQVSEKMLQGMAREEQGRRISELAQSIKDLDRRLNRLDDRFQRLDNDLKEIKRKI